MAAKKIILGLVIILVLSPLVLAAVRTFRVQETDFLKVSLNVTDADGDELTFAYSPPLDEQGEWQTDYDDAGEYDVDVTISDGVHELVRKIKIIVENKNQPPLQTESHISVREGAIVDLRDIVDDPDGDALAFTFEEPFDKEGKWQTSLNDAGIYLTSFTVRDAEFTEEMRAEITIINTNQPPVVTGSFSKSSIVHAEEDIPFKYWVEVNDGDNDGIQYKWELDGVVIEEDSAGQHYFDFFSAGEHALTVTASDNLAQTAQTWTVLVENVNRKPELTILPITVREGEKIIFNLPPADSDNDPVTYSFEEPFTAEGEWQTSYDDAGEYSITVRASDGDLIGKETVQVTVVEVDRAPTLEVPVKLEAYENGDLVFTVDAADPDGDVVDITFKGLPEDASFDAQKHTVRWTPGYDFIRRRGGAISSFLNTMRIERFFLARKSVPITITACGKELCTSKKMALLVRNVNRAPYFTSVQNITVTETDVAELSVQGADPDGDIIRYYFTSPLGRRNGQWKTDYQDEGLYTTYATVTDGSSGETIPITIYISNKNRQPSLHINDDDLTVREGQEFMFEVSGSDPDSDDLEIVLTNPPTGSSFRDGVFLWEPGYDTVRNHDNQSALAQSLDEVKRKGDLRETLWLEFVASDGEFNVTHPVKITVKDVNAAPELIDYTPAAKITAGIGEPIVFNAVVNDPDNDPLFYEWDFGRRQDKVTGARAVSRTYVTPGEKNVQVRVSDGLEESEKEWVVYVEKPAVVEQPEPVLASPEQPPFSVTVAVVKG